MQSVVKESFRRVVVLVVRVVGFSAVAFLRGYSSFREDARGLEV